MSKPRLALHALTTALFLLGAGIAFVSPNGPGAPLAASVAYPVDRATSSTATTMPAESFAPSNQPDTFEVSTVAPRLQPTTPTTAEPPAWSPVATMSVSVNSSYDDTSTLVDASPQLVATLKRAVYVYADVGGDSPFEALAMTTEFGNPRVLPIVQLGGDWMRVALPTRPNGSLGWIRARDATVSSVSDRVDVDLGARSLTWMRGGEVRLTATVSVGAPASPTPGGDFFVTDVLPYPAASAYGAWVVALNGHSDAFTEFDGGDARIAIHGTNDPSSIGRAASNGCVRMGAAALGALAGALQPGTSVTIH